MLRIAALASSVVASIPTVRPNTSLASASRCNTHVNTGRQVELTATEYELLRVLSLGAGRGATYDALLRQVWAGRAYGNPGKLVRAFVKRLRQKLGDDAGNPAYIVTERGVRYRMARPDET